MLFFFFLIINLYYLIPAVIAQIFNPIAELVIPIGMPTKEAKAEIEIYPVIVEAKIRKLFNIIQSSTNLFVLFACQFISIYFFS